MKMTKTFATVVLCLMLMMSTAVAATSYNAGTYEAVAQGNNAPVKVNVSFSESAITQISILEQQETEGLGDQAFAIIPDEIILNQSLAVDTVSGATNSSNAILNAVADCVAQAGGDVEMLKAASVASEVAEDIEATYDVVIVGGGGAGLTAAVSAAQHGAKVVVIEKAGMLGGNTLIAGQGFNAADPEREGAMTLDPGLNKMLEGYLELQPEDFGEFSSVLATVQDQIKRYQASGATYQFDTPELHMLHCYIGSTRTGLDGTVISPDYDLIKVYAQSALDGLKWFESIGGEWEDITYSIVGSMWPRSHFLKNGNAIDILHDAARNAGVEFMMNTRGTKLITENSKVCGVIAEGKGGSTVTLHATKSVILATGGFAANGAMVAEYNNYWDGLDASMASTNSVNITGDGIIMAKDVGAELIGMGFAQLMPMSDPIDGSLFTGVWGSAETQFFVNKEGKRFVNEYAERDVLSKAALEQTDGMFYIICDRDEWETVSEAELVQMENNGRIVRADTLEELAEKLRIPVDTFLDTVAKYNGYVASGVDPDFGKQFFGTPCDNGPYVATPRSPSLHHTMGGIRIDTNAQVIDTEGNAIHGLFAAGEVCGGIHAGNRLGGNAMTDFLVFGRIAGENAVK